MAGGGIGLGAVLTACGIGGGEEAGAGTTTATGSTAAGTTATTSVATGTTAEGGVTALLDAAPRCVLAREETEGPYWFDVDSIRRDIREDRPGAPLELAFRVQDISACAAGGEPAPVASCVVEIWHCDAGGVYSGFESGQAGPPGGGGGGELSDGSYSSGDDQASPTDDGTFLRGAQATDADSIARFTTIYPGWYRGRTTHIHLKVHIDRATVLTSQVYMDDTLTDAVYATSPYDAYGTRETRNDDDMIFDSTGLLAVSEAGDGYVGVINLGIET